MVAALLCYDASCRILTDGREQTVPLRIYLAEICSTPSPPSQLITAILLPPHTTPCYTAYNAVYQDQGHRVLLVGVAVAATMRPDGQQQWWVVVTGVPPFLRRFPTIEQALAQGVPLKQVSALLSSHIQPRDDLHASASYRLAMAAQMLRESAQTVMAQIKRNTS